MIDIKNPVVWVVGAATFAFAWLMVRGRLSAETRERRRRERSHRPVVSRKHGPTVKLAVDVEKENRDRKS